ncbi:ankyrin [Westerdykella ornata]|uniref:Ankyrin n=1 Tax=Westerdykella ornata TaxID=318751 RepID=A0A6A6JMT6_WESOR|nr:ankyrin [Westerdykella ornata]KAF2277837.1 ankyrin [Westerdykella ornata]
MPEELLRGTQHSLTFAQIQNRTDALLATFLNACGNNDAALALQLAPNRDAGALTFGLNRAIGGSHLDLARQLLGAGAKWDAQTVRLASRSLDAVKLLVECGFDVNTGLVAGGTLLPKVVGHNDEPCVRYLLERGANPNLGPPSIKNGPLYLIHPIPNSGWALNAAAAFSTPEIFALLLSYGADISNAIPLHYAVRTSPKEVPGSRIPMLEYLVGLGLDINAMDDADDGLGQHGTPLQHAVTWRRVEEAKWLLDRGADPDKKNPWGISARDQVKRLPPSHELAILLSTSQTERPSEEQ